MSGYVRWARFAFNVVAWLFVACVGVQIYLAGLGVFADSSNFATHAGFGFLFGLLTLVLIPLAILGRLGRWTIGGTILLLVMFAMQSFFVSVRDTTPAAAALHPLNGFLIGLLSVGLAWRTRGYIRLSAAQAPTPAESATDNRAG
jgi:Family of unknown function (DUF6220)